MNSKVQSKLDTASRCRRQDLTHNRCVVYDHNITTKEVKT